MGRAYLGRRAGLQAGVSTGSRSGQECPISACVGSTAISLSLQAQSLQGLWSLPSNVESVNSVLRRSGGKLLSLMCHTTPSADRPCGCAYDKTNDTHETSAVRAVSRLTNDRFAVSGLWPCTDRAVHLIIRSHHFTDMAYVAGVRGETQNRRPSTRAPRGPRVGVAEITISVTPKRRQKVLEISHVIETGEDRQLTTLSSHSPESGQFYSLFDQFNRKRTTGVKAMSEGHCHKMPEVHDLGQNGPTDAGPDARPAATRLPRPADARQRQADDTAVYIGSLHHDYFADFLAIEASAALLSRGPGKHAVGTFGGVPGNQLRVDNCSSKAAGVCAMNDKYTCLQADVEFRFTAPEFPRRVTPGPCRQLGACDRRPPHSPAAAWVPGCFQGLHGQFLGSSQSRANTPQRKFTTVPLSAHEEEEQRARYYYYREDVNLSASNGRGRFPSLFLTSLCQASRLQDTAASLYQRSRLLALPGFEKRLLALSGFGLRLRSSLPRVGQPAPPLRAAGMPGGAPRSRGKASLAHPGPPPCHPDTTAMPARWGGGGPCEECPGVRPSAGDGPSAPPRYNPINSTRILRLYVLPGQLDMCNAIRRMCDQQHSVQLFLGNVRQGACRLEMTGMRPLDTRGAAKRWRRFPPVSKSARHIPITQTQAAGQDGNSARLFRR
ncbi:hypothetical protein Bbelb_161910 [Branchiostoma belcheri]|nr:hypothetical protein Bbelb_161910 [Branchiostoma belcheri]